MKPTVGLRALRWGAVVLGLLVPTGDRIEGWWSSGPHEVSLDARRLSPGVYSARLTAAGTSAVVRLVHI
jgi:hypothetical protein